MRRTIVDRPGPRRPALRVAAALGGRQAARAPARAGLGLPGQAELEAPAAVQERAMRCMTDFARRHAARLGG